MSPETVSSFQLGALITFPLHLHVNRSLPVNNALSVVSAVCPDEIITLACGCHSRRSQPLALHARTHVFSRPSDGADETQIAGCTELAGAGGRGGGDLRRSLSEPLVLIEVDPSHFQNSSGGLSHSVADVFLYHEMCSCRVVWTGERQVANHACGPWRKCFDALQPLGDDIWLYKRLIVYFGPVSGSCDIFQCTKLLHEFNGWKESHTSRRKTQLLHTAPD